MARKKLSKQGRVAAAGVSLAVAGVLAGFMAAGDHTATASQPASSSATSPSNSNATSFPNDQRTFGDQSGQFQPQPQTRTGGS